MYAPSSKGVLTINRGGTYEPLSRITDWAVSHNEPTTDAPDDAMDNTVSAGASSVGDPTAGTATFTLQPPDVASAVFQTFRNSFIKGTEVQFQVWLGNYRLVREVKAADNATIQIVAADSEAILAGAGSEAVPNTFGTGDKQPGPFWDRGQVIEYNDIAYHLGPWKTATKRVISRIGAIAGGIAAYDEVALGDVAAQGAFKVHQYVWRVTGKGRVTAGGDFTVSQGSLAVDGSIQLADFETMEVALKDWALA